MIAIGSWNLENLFRPGGDAGPTSQTAYRAKLAALAGTIAGLAPDVLAVQEVGPPVALADLVAELGGGWHTAVADPDGRGIRVGVLSRHPLTDVEQVVAFPEHLRPVQVDDDGATMAAMGRPALRARVHAGGVVVDVVSCHLKSKLLTFPGGRFAPKDDDERARYAVYALHRRAAEAAAIRAYVTRLLHDHGPGTAVVLAGDLNDEPQAATTQLLHGPPGSEIGTGGFNRPDAGDAQRLWNLASRIPSEQRYTRIYQGRRELIDHLLVSQAVLHSATTVVTGHTPIDAVTDQPTDRRDVPGSDHRPVLVRLDLP